MVRRASARHCVDPQHFGGGLSLAGSTRVMGQVSALLCVGPRRGAARRGAAPADLLIINFNSV